MLDSAGPSIACSEFFPRLAERRVHRGGQLSGGERGMLAVGRALMIDPELILMDEPSEGLAPVMVISFARHISRFIEGRNLPARSSILKQPRLLSGRAVPH